MDFNIEEYINNLPIDIEDLYLSYKNFTYLPSLKKFFRLKMIRCYYTNLEFIYDLPDSLECLYCYHSKLSTLPKLPNNLLRLECEHNKLEILPELPSSLIALYCNNNNLEVLSELPKKLMILICNNNKLKDIPRIPTTLKVLDCSNNKICKIPYIYNELEKYYGYNNVIPIENMNSLIKLNKFMNLFYRLQYSGRIERFYIKNVRNRDINLELLFSPTNKYKFYIQFINPITLSIMKNI